MDPSWVFHRTIGLEIMTSGSLTAAGLNQSALVICQHAQTQAHGLSIDYHRLPCGAHLLDFGVHARGGLAAGVELARVALAGRADVALVTGDRTISAGPWVQVSSNQPIEACMFSQYAGWPVQHGKFFAMGSGPMRVRRGREEVLSHLAAHDPQALAIGTLECDKLPDCSIAEMMATQCDVLPAELWLAIAPTRSIAGCVQVVARSVETSLHKLHALGFDLSQVRSGYGTAPVPPPTPNFVLGIGRTNDAILYAGMVTLWVEGDDEQIEAIGSKVPSNSSADYGLPFAEIFKRYDNDFYKVDPGLFSPAVVTLINLSTGRSWTFGDLRPDVIAKSFVA